MGVSGGSTIGSGGAQRTATRVRTGGGSAAGGFGDGVVAARETGGFRVSGHCGRISRSGAAATSKRPVMRIPPGSIVAGTGFSRTGTGAAPDVRATDRETEVSGCEVEPSDDEEPDDKDGVEPNDRLPLTAGAELAKPCAVEIDGDDGEDESLSAIALNSTINPFCP